MLGTGELLILLAVVCLLFGSTKLPSLARSIGQAQKEFQHGLRNVGQAKDSDPAPTTDATAATEAEPKS
jgi:sec-independent protein translocase protein TatA